MEAGKKADEVAEQIKAALAEAGHPVTRIAVEAEKSRASGKLRFADGVEVVLYVRLRVKTWWVSIEGNILAGRPYRKDWRETKSGFRFAEMASTAVELADRERAYQKREAGRAAAEERVEHLRATYAVTGKGPLAIEADGADGVVTFTGLSDAHIGMLVVIARKHRMVPEREEG